MAPFLPKDVWEKVILPATIPCSQCRVPKPQALYSPNRLKDLKKIIVTENINNRKFNAQVDRVICCSKCLGNPPVEKECYHCEITFPKTDRYFSKNMLKNRKDEALCWSCSEREQNDTLSSDDEGSATGSDDSDTTFITNRFQDIESTTSDTTSASGFVDNSSGGVSLSGSNAPSAGHTVYAGSASSMLGSARGTITSPSVGRASSAVGSSTAGASPSVASSRAPPSTGLPRGFNANKYGNPGRRSPTSSVASGTSSKASANFPKIPAVPTYINSDAAREQQRDMKRRAAANSDFKDMQVSDSDSSEGSGPKSGPSKHAAGKRTPAKGPSPKPAEKIEETRSEDADKVQDGWREGTSSKLPMNQRSQTKTDISCVVYSQEEQLDEVAGRSDMDFTDGNDDDYHDSDDDALP